MMKIFRKVTLNLLNPIDEKYFMELLDEESTLQKPGDEYIYCNPYNGEYTAYRLKVVEQRINKDRRLEQ